MNQEHVTKAANDCPSALALQRFASCPEESDAGMGAHVAACARCQAFLAERQAEGATYMRSPAAAALRQRLAALETQGPQQSVVRVPRSWAWGGALAAAASLALFLSTNPPGRSQPEADALTPKGTAQLALWIGDQGTAQGELAESAVLRPGARVQPVFSAPSSGFVALVLTSPSGVRVQLHPAGQTQSARVQAAPQAPLGPSFRLDEEAGSYRVTAYFAEESFSTQPLLASSDREEPTFRGLVLMRKFAVQP